MRAVSVINKPAIASLGTLRPASFVTALAAPLRIVFVNAAG